MVAMQGEALVPVDGRRRAGATAAVALLLALVAGLLYVAGSHDEPSAGAALAQQISTPIRSQPPAPSVDSAVLRVQALDQLLETRAAAVLDRDLAAWMATVDPLSGEFAHQQAEVFSNLRAVPLAGWRYEYAGTGRALAPGRSAALGPDAWVARIVLVYRLSDSELGEVRREQSFTLVRRGEQWLVAGHADGASTPDLWDLGPVQVVRGSRSLVLGTAATDVLQRYARETDEAAGRVDLVWGEAGPRAVVVLVPRSQTEMAKLLQRAHESGLDQIAAVTTGDAGADPHATAADWIVVNPAGFDRLGGLGRQVVLRHEITHVATRATTSHDVPIWLSEGFADYVAYRDSGMSRAVVAQDVLERVRAGQPPPALPVPADFDSSRGDIAPAYAAAWLAAELIERRWSEQALVELYTAVADGATTLDAFPRVLGVQESAFTQEWRAYLAELAA
jgi:hypothetical protein